ncbi:hypothetical protein [Candidatus Bandiella euplotis]|uniref:hypothetical protein n=1 Tax=Candidatus Bandiella euplotis TaxID=1664265 RepID=UPI002B25ACE0|nr:hypothetical protein [Candidatus Bandiella woodruffii]
MRQNPKERLLHNRRKKWGIIKGLAIWDLTPFFFTTIVQNSGYLNSILTDRRCNGIRSMTTPIFAL